jgi:ribosome recycling factor
MGIIKEIEKQADEKMLQSVSFLEEALSRIRAGKANVHILDGVKVEYYGSLVALSNVANISTPDAKTITILPWEKSMMKTIEKAIQNSDVGITPENNGEIIRLGIPPLTEERRKLLVKQSRAEAENAKVSVRNTRRDANEASKKAVKNGTPEDDGKETETAIQKLHDKYLKKIDELLTAKEKEIMTV